MDEHTSTKSSSKHRTEIVWIGEPDKFITVCTMLSVGNNGDMSSLCNLFNGVEVGPAKVVSNMAVWSEVSLTVGPTFDMMRSIERQFISSDSWGQPLRSRTSRWDTGGVVSHRESPR